MLFRYLFLTLPLICFPAQGGLLECSGNYAGVNGQSPAAPTVLPRESKTDPSAGQVVVQSLGNGVSITTQKSADGQVVPVTIHDGREMIHVVKDGKGIWFYRSFTGGGGKDQGRWYPCGGLAKDKYGMTWIIKGLPHTDKGFGRKGLQELEDYVNEKMPHSDAEVDAWIHSKMKVASLHDVPDKAPSLQVDSLTDATMTQILLAWKAQYLNRVWGERTASP